MDEQERDLLGGENMYVTSFQRWALVCMLECVGLFLLFCVATALAFAVKALIGGQFIVTCEVVALVVFGALLFTVLPAAPWKPKLWHRAGLLISWVVSSTLGIFAWLAPEPWIILGLAVLPTALLAVLVFLLFPAVQVRLDEEDELSDDQAENEELPDDEVADED